MSNQVDHTIVRLRVPPELKKQIEESAEKNNRSQSAEMVARLEQSFKSFGGTEDTQKLLESAVMLTLKAVKDDPNLINNPKVTVVSQGDTTSNNESRVSLINANKKAP